MAKLRDNQVVIQFGANISGDVQAKAMMQFEKWLRTLTSRDIEVFKEVKADDSKLRNMMTPEERMKL
jgi:hypothetical protein